MVDDRHRISAARSSVTRRCLQCGYALDFLPVNRCPECSRPFDPEDPATYVEQRPGEPAWWRHELVRLARTGACATMIGHVLALVGPVLPGLLAGFFIVFAAIIASIAIGFHLTVIMLASPILVGIGDRGSAIAMSISMLCLFSCGGSIWLLGLLYG